MADVTILAMRHSVDPHANPHQRELLTRFLGRAGVDEKALTPGGLGRDLARTHTSITYEERNRLDNLCFKMGTHPCAVLRGLIRGLLDEHKGVIDGPG